MTLRNWIIDLRIDFESDHQAELMLTAIRASAKELLVTARLLADKRPPDIAIQADDLFIGRNDVELFSPEEKEEYGL